MIDWDSCVLWLDSRCFSESYWWDRSKYANNGVVHGAVWKEDSFYFGGNTQYVRVYYHPVLDFGYNPFSIETVIKTTYKSNYQGIVFHYHGKGYVLVTMKNTGKVKFTITTSGLESNSDVCDGELHHIIATRGAAPDYDVKIYIDRELDATGSNNQRARPNYDVDLGIGMYIEPYFGNYSFHGDIKLVRLYEKELSEDEVDILGRAEGF